MEQRRPPLRSILVWLGFIIALGAFHFSWIPNSDSRGFSAIIQSTFTLLLFAYVFLAALGIGRRVLAFLRTLSRLEFNLLALLCGLAILANGILILGLLGVFHPSAILLWLSAAGLFASFQWREIVGDFSKAINSFDHARFVGFGIFEYILLGVIGILAVFLPLLSLAPVHDYDALMYHLEIPRQFLAQGRVYFDPEIWRSTYPMLTGMLYSIGIVFRLEPFAQLISLTFFVVFLLSVYAFGRRLFDQKTALLAVGILLGNPAFTVYAVAPSVEFSWAGYEFWGMYAFSLWFFEEKDTNRSQWLVMAGILSGLAASVKYLSFPTIAIIGLLILWKTFQAEGADLKKITRNLLLFGVPALVLILPWYLKNWFWTGNPFYPLMFGGPAWTDLRNELYFNDYMGSFGTGRGWLDYLLIPVNLYLAQPRYAAMSLEFFHPALWLGFGFGFLEKWRKHDHLVAYIVIGVALWVTSAQVIRFLLPLSGFLALFSAMVLSHFPRRIKQFVTVGVVGALMIVTAAYQVWMIGDSNLLGYFGGKISKNEFLQQEVYDYRTVQFIQSSLQLTDRVLFLWAGQGYYCDSRCLPDDDENLAIQLSINDPTPEALARQLRSDGVTHILLGRPNVYWFISYHDPQKRHQTALDYFEKDFLPACGESIFSDGSLELFALTCK